MLPDRVSNPGPLTYESGPLPIALRGPAAVYLLLGALSMEAELHKRILCLLYNLITSTNETDFQ